jgi:hypothetical protein
MPAASADQFVSQRRQQRAAPGITIAALAGATALVVACFALADIVHAVRAMRWPTVPGTIVTSEIRGDFVEYGIGPRSGRVYAQTTSHFYTTYKYTVDGREYTSGRVDVLTDGGADRQHERLRRYPVGAAVQVHVSPSDPMEAALEVGWPVGVTIKAIVAALIAIVLLHWAYTGSESGTA